MKFGRYLAENQTPEWKRAYIDYRGCKKKIKVIQKRLGQIPAEAVDDDEDDNDGQGGGANNNNNNNGGSAGHAPRRVRDSDDSSDNGDYGPSKMPKDTTASLGGGGASSVKRTNSVASRPTSTPRTFKSPGRSSINYGAMSTSPRPTQDSLPSAHPPHLDIGEPSVSSPPNTATSPAITRVRSHTRNVTFQSEQPVSPPHAVGHGGDDVDRRVSDSSSSGQDDAMGDDGPSSSKDPLAPHGSRDDDDEDDHAGHQRSPSGGGGLSPRTKAQPTKSPRLAIIRNAFSPKQQQQQQQAVNDSPASGPRGNRSLRSVTLPSPLMLSRQSSGSARTAKCFDDLYDEMLEPDEKEFFDFLDSQVEKVDAFYVARQNEAIRRAHELRSQLRELAEHRKLYHELYPEGQPQWEATVERYIPAVAVARSTHWAEAKDRMSHMIQIKLGNGNATAPTAAATPKETPCAAVTGEPDENGDRPDMGVAAARKREALRRAMLADKDHLEYSPERYRKYKAELRKATLEFYRQVELIKNYRIMNITGFRKALKKFEKVTNRHCMELYTDDRIMTEAFAQPETIDKLLKETEDLFSVHFEHGDAKKARDRLRRQDQPSHSHYMSIFRSGLCLGVGLSAAIVALVRADEPATQERIPNWDALLIVYGGIYIPVIFACLFELNLDAWVSARINYEFVMEMSNPTLDYRSYLEMPAFLFMTLSVCMYFSFHLIGVETVAPTTWPAAWLVFLAVFFLNPLPIFRRRSRYWLLRVLFRVLTPGISRVEFIAFFLADELNSLVFSIQDIMFLSCAYGNKWPADTYGVCHYASDWPYILISIIPALCRFIQCLKRYHDSRLTIHLINAGKYISTMLQYTFYILWRSSGSDLRGGYFIAWIIIATIYSVYNCSWDFVVDWSLLRPASAGLRPDLGYSNRYIYYFAMLTNFLARFYWVWYLPVPSRARHLRSFILATVEMLRRWQWNFFRVETEHLGNADAYRVTREIPLPYRRADIELDSDEDSPPGAAAGATAGRSSGKGGGSRTGGGGSSGGKTKLSVRLERLKRGLVGGDMDGRGTSALNVGARGHAAQREYEARRPGDAGLRARSRSTLGGGDDPLEEV